MMTKHFILKFASILCTNIIINQILYQGNKRPETTLLLLFKSFVILISVNPLLKNNFFTIAL